MQQRSSLTAFSELRDQIEAFVAPTPEARSGRGWKKVRLESVMHPTADAVPVQLDKSYRNFGIFSFGRGLFAKPEIDGGSTSARTLYRVRAGQFIYSRLVAFEGAYGFVTSDFDGYFVSNEFPTFDTDAVELDAEWLSMYLRSADRWLELATSSKGLGVRRQRVPVEAVLAFEIWLPPIREQNVMVQTINAIDELARKRTVANKALDALVPAALNAAFGVVDPVND